MSKDVQIFSTQGDAKSTETAPPTTLEQYGLWFKSFEWKWWVTLTNSRDVSRLQEKALLKRYINKLESQPPRLPVLSHRAGAEDPFRLR